MQRRRQKASNYTLDSKPSDFIDEKYVERTSLWILRILFYLGGHKEFIDKDAYVSKDDIIYFLGGEKYENDGEKPQQTRKNILADFSQKLEQLESKKLQNSSDTILAKNIEKITTIVTLNEYEKQILEFLILIKQYEILDDAVSLLGNNLTTKQVKRALSVILDIPQDKIDEALKSDAKLVKSSLISIDKQNTNALERKLDSISDAFVDNMANTDEEILTMLKDILRPCDKSDLELEDYQYLKKDINIIFAHLKNSIKAKRKGVNILLYGPAGTGKTELTKLLAQELNSTLYEVSYADEDDESMDEKERIKAYKSAQALLATQKTILMYDEAEDIFESNGGSFFTAPSRQKAKAWINRMLESNSVPTVWITNNIYSIDDALVRRFDYTLELPMPKKSQRKKIIQKYSEDILDKKSVKLLSSNPNIAPALIARATKVVKNIQSKTSSKDFMRILNNTLKAQGYGGIKKSKKDKKDNHLPSIYNPTFINSGTNLEELSNGIKKHPNARVCLYGPAGTGKSAYGRYIAKELKKKVIIKKASDLMDMYVGSTEKNIASAFAEAKKKKAVLVFDEVDSFLSDRSGAQRSWEVSQVNEMLVQMENFDGIFIATTNLIDYLDKASLRRFDMKIKFDYLNSSQTWEMFKVFSKELKLSRYTKQTEKRVKDIENLTPGDFAAVDRQHRFRPIKDIEDFISRLKSEVDIKQVESSGSLGFLNG